MKSIFSVLTYLFLSFSILGISSYAYSAIDVYEFESPQQEAQYRMLIAEFRCPKCQNQNLASSDSPISKDLKYRVYELVQADKSDEQIRQFMQSRYGDFINYKPPVRPSTYLIWFLPPSLLFLAIVGWLLRMKTLSKKMSNQRTSNKSINVYVKPSNKQRTSLVKDNSTLSTMGLSEQQQLRLDKLLDSGSGVDSVNSLDNSSVKTADGNTDDNKGAL